MRLWWLSPGDPSQRTGGYLYNARMVTELRRRGWSVELLAMDGRWPLPGAETPEILEAIPDRALVLADGLLWTGLGASGARLASRCRVTVLVHSLLCQEIGPEPLEAEALDRAERTALGLAARTVATSALTRRALGGGAVVIPGTDPAERSRGGDGTRLLTVGTLIRRKGHDRLLEALAGISLPWSLICAGAPRDPQWAGQLSRRAAELGLGSRVSFAGDLGTEALEALYRGADLVVQAAAFEAFGMAIAEAIARGLPVVTTSAGVLDHLPAGAALEVEPGALGGAIASLLGDPGAREAQAEQARSAARSLPTWEAQASSLADLLLETR